MRKGPEKRFKVKLPQIPITTEAKDLLQAVASDRNMSLSALVREALDEYLDRQPADEIEKAKESLLPIVS